MPLFRETPEAITRSWEPLTGLLYADKPIIYPFIIPQRPEIVSSRGDPLSKIAMPRAEEGSLTGGELTGAQRISTGDAVLR